MTRGDVVAVADRGGDYTGKPRPAVIVQSDDFADTASMTICPLTRVEKDAPLLRVRVEPGEGLPLAATSWIEVEKITTVRRDRLGPHIGALPPEAMAALNRSLLVFLGIG